MAVDRLIKKIQSLPPEKVAEVEDFVDFLHLRLSADRSGSVAKLAEEAFAQAWDNAEDAVYDGR